MPVYQTKDQVLCGIPFGGIGAGKFEVTPQGLFNAFTFQNNWSQPLAGVNGYPGVLGFHLGVRANGKAFLLQTVPVLQIPTVKNIRYEGFFPKATLVYEAPGLGLEVRLEICAPWVLGHAENSSLPAVFFQFTLINKTKASVDAGLLFIGRNTSGAWCVGRQNKIHADHRAVAIEFANHDPSAHDETQGSLKFNFLRQGWDLSYMERWNAVTKNFSFTPQNISLPAWDHFSKNESLPNTALSFVAQGENQELCGAIMAKRILAPGEKKRLVFNASWYFPKHRFGHRYQNSSKSIADVSKRATLMQSGMQAKVEKLQRHLSQLPFPDWFNDALLTSLTPFYASSWFTRDGRFSFYEAPSVCPLMGTIDVGFYGSIPLSYFFPKLEKSLIRQFALAQRKDGYIPHDLGKNRLDMPSNGTTFYYWKDLNPKFILMAYRDFLWSGDMKFLKFMYPYVKKAIQWSLRMDFDGNGLPDNEGEDQTFDLWQLRGTNAYTSSIFLAALLACEKMATLLKDPVFRKECRENFIKGQRSFDRELWNGSFYGEACSLSQLNGQWYADLLGLGWIVKKDRVRKTLQCILKLHRKHSRFGLINSTLPDGRPDNSNDHSKNIWLGMNYAFISLCVSQGFPLSDLLKEAYKIWDNVVNEQKSPWNTPDMINAATGQYMFGDFYYRNMAIWSIPIAYAKKNKKTASILRSLRSF